MENLQILHTHLSNPHRPRSSQLFIQQQSITNIRLLPQISQQSAQDGAILDSLRSALRSEYQISIVMKRVIETRISYR